MLVWDGPHDPPSTGDLVVDWNGYAEGPKRRSVLRHLEANAERLRERYLAYVYGLGEARLDGRSVIEHFARPDGFSYWWMTQVAEKSPLKSPRIEEALRLLALEEMLRELEPEGVRLATGDEGVRNAIRGTCDRLGIPCVAEPVAASRRSGPRPRHALVHGLRHIARRWPLRRSAGADWSGSGGVVTFCSYFINIDAPSASASEFSSGMWGDVAPLLRANGTATRWLHHYLRSAAVPTARRAVAWCNAFSAVHPRLERHAFVESFLSARVVTAALRDWRRLVSRSRQLEPAAAAVRPPDSAADVWPLMVDDWRLSLAGWIGLRNCLWMALFDAALSRTPTQRLGLYLYENQGWEAAFLHAWRRHGHGRVVGVQHTTTPFWHLYNFDDPRTRSGPANGRKPLPDQLAVNGPLARGSFREAGYAEEFLVDVEAVRYEDLAGARAARAARGARTGALRVLVVGDMGVESTDNLLGTVAAAAPELDACEFAWKPHPGYDPGLARYDGLRAAVVREPLASILADHDLVISANSTSAGLDALVVGLPVVAMLDRGVNLSPLRGQPGVTFVSTAAELVNAVRTAGHSAAARVAPDAFYLDARLPRWRRLLGIAAERT